jgi:hypothetical protein
MATREAWSLDKLAKEFQFIQKEESGKITTGRAQIVTLCAQEDVSEPAQIFLREFLIPEKAKGRRYRGPGQAKVIEEALQRQRERFRVGTSAAPIRNSSSITILSYSCQWAAGKHVSIYAIRLPTFWSFGPQFARQHG